MAPSLAKEVGDVSAAGSHGTCSNGGNRKDKHGNGKPLTEGRVSPKEPICYRCR